MGPYAYCMHRWRLLSEWEGSEFFVLGVVQAPIVPVDIEWGMRCTHRRNEDFYFVHPFVSLDATGEEARDVAFRLGVWSLNLFRPHNIQKYLRIQLLIGWNVNKLKLLKSGVKLAFVLGAQYSSEDGLIS